MKEITQETEKACQKIVEAYWLAPDDEMVSHELRDGLVYGYDKDGGVRFVMSPELFNKVYAEE